MFDISKENDTNISPFGQRNESDSKLVTCKEFISQMDDYVDESVFDWLCKIGFFTAPASVSHHANYSGGLYLHSLEVMNQLLSLTEKLALRWKMGRSPYIVGMFHDICKCDNYRRTGEDTWEYNNDVLLPGHGEKSVIVLQQRMKLTDEEMYCIRWHMGAFDEKSNRNKYGLVVTKFPNVLYTHTADMIASKIIGL